MSSNVFLPFLTGWDGKALKEAERQLGAFGGSIKNFARGVISAFGGVSATVASVNFVRGAITQSRDLERQTAALKSVFGEASGEMLAFSQNGVKMGLSTASAAKASTFLGSVLKSAGFEMDAVASNTKMLTSLAADLATTYGYDVSEALTGMTALFRGEYDPIEKFGVAMKQAEVNTILAARGQKNLTGQELLHAQQLIRLELLMQRTTDAQGAFTRQGDSLFVQQSKLSALWENMQATIGNQLTPALAGFLQRLQPIVEDFAPHLEKIFASFGALIEVIIPKLGTFADKVAHLFDIISDAFSRSNPLLSGFLGLIIDNIDSILTFIIVFKTLKKTIDLTVAGIQVYTTAVKIATGATAGLTVAQMATPWGLVAVGIAGLVAGLIVLDGQLKDAKEKMDDTTGSFKNMAENLAKNPFEASTVGAKLYGDALADVIVRQKKVQEDLSNFNSDETSRFISRKGSFAADYIAPSLTGNGAGSGAGSATGKAVKTFFDTLGEEIKKQALKIKLSGLGASEALIDAVLGSSAWEAAANKIIAGGTKTVDFVQRQFNKTKAGLDEIAKAAEEAAKKIEEYNKKVQEATDFGSELADVVKGLASSGVTEALGAFEQSVVGTFESIVSKVNDGVRNELITPEDASNLLKYAAASEVAMRAIAKQRDVLADRIQTVRELISATKSAVMGFVNINSLLETQTKTITQSVVSVSDGIRLTLTNSMDVTSVTGSITDKFKEILAKTKQFAINLRELKRLGLDQNLFKQIVDAGLESGGATAAAIIEGGAGTVSELNSLFKDLETTGADIAEQTAQVMYGAGVDITNGLINGLLAQQSALESAAKALADSFSNAFNSSVAIALQTKLGPAPEIPLDSETLAMNNILSGVGAGAGGGRPHFNVASVGEPTIFNVTVNAGLGTSGATVAQEIVSTLKQYERTNGAVWVSA